MRPNVAAQATLSGYEVAVPAGRIRLWRLQRLVPSSHDTADAHVDHITLFGLVKAL